MSAVEKLEEALLITTKKQGYHVATRLTSTGIPLTDFLDRERVRLKINV
jgi:hypothetical protein